MYLSLNGTIIPNRGYVLIGDIGSIGDNTALLCHTNHPPLSGEANSGGDWFAPDGTRVNANDVPGFRRNRGPMVVRLYRNVGFDSPPQGIYYCQIKDNTSTLQNVTVGLYNSRGGIIFK